jgi:hypothetical protein
MSDFQTIADRVEIEALRGEFTDAAMMRLRPPRVAVHPYGALRMPNIPVELVGRRSAPEARGTGSRGLLGADHIRPAR